MLFYVCIWKISVNKFFLDQYLQFVVVSWDEEIPFLDPHLKNVLEIIEAFKPYCIFFSL